MTKFERYTAPKVEVGVRKRREEVGVLQPGLVVPPQKKEVGRGSKAPSKSRHD